MSPYNPVYHFRDADLLDVFISNIPRSLLLKYLSADEPLRTRYFPGFRISKTIPTIHQIQVAYRKEIVDRKNGQIASSLCADWVGQYPVLADSALRRLGIQAEDPANALEWIGDVQTRLESEPSEVTLLELANFLSAQFSKEEILIFISIVSYGVDTGNLRTLVEQELTSALSAPCRIKERTEHDIQSTVQRIEELKRCKSDLDQQRRDEQDKLHQALSATELEHDKVTASLAQSDILIQESTRQLEGLKRKLVEQKHAQEVIEKLSQKLAKIIARQRAECFSVDAKFEKRIDEITQDVNLQIDRKAELETLLEQAEKQLQEAQRKQQEQPAPAVDRIQEASAVPVPETLTSPASVPDEIQNQEPSDRLIDVIGRNALCYQGLQRVFRNTVVAFLRDRFNRLFPGDHVQRVKKLFGDDWDKASLNANLSRQGLGTTTVVRDDYDLLGTNHFFAIFDRYYDKLFALEAGQPENLPKPVKTRFLGNLKAIKDGRDPLSHPVEEEISFDEAHHLLYAAQEILKWMGCDTQAKELATLTEQLGIGQPEMESLLRRVPSEDSIYLEFVGRNTLLDELTQCFANPDNKRCLLAGDGGKGKSAVAYRFVQTLPAPLKRFQLIIWLSAKKRRFREGATTAIELPDFTTSEDAVDRLLKEYGAAAKDLESSAADKKRLLFECLNDFPAFIIADDVDTVLEDDEVVSLFTHEIPHTQSAVLLTSRRAIPGVRSFVVQGFDSVEAEEFVKSRIRLYKLNAATFTPAIIKEIARTTDGSPLYMDDLMRLTKIVDVQKAIKVWTEKSGDEARKYALEREFEKLTADSRKVLIAAAISDAPISFAELEFVVEASEERLLLALSELQTLFLFPKFPAVEGEQRYQINLNTKKLVRLVEGQTDLYARIDNRAKALAGKLPEVGPGIVGSLITQALLRFNANQQGTEAETLLLGAIDKYPNSPDLHGALGYVYRRHGRIADARDQFEAAFKLKAKRRDMYVHWIKMEIAVKEWSNAIQVADRALEAIPDFYEIIERKVFALRQAGFDFHRGLHREKAAKMWVAAVDLTKRRIKSPETLRAGERVLNASLFASVVICLDMLRDFRERNRWLERWEKEHPDDSQVAIQKEYLKNKRGTFQAAATV
jgi:tetratricopeptide (TPR) repeat protein